MGNETYLNRNAEVISAAQVHIGHDRKIGWEVITMDTDQHGTGDQPTARPTWIGDRVWIGCRALTLKGVTIGDDEVIGAIVTQDAPLVGVALGPAATVRGFVSATLSPDEARDQVSSASCASGSCA
jgi:acetyltransferase-like isoleucine patch superfamily enzyme